MKNRSWIAHAATATWAAFIVLCLVSIANSRIGGLRSQQSMELSQLGLVSIAPENLPGAAETFRVSIPGQDADFPVKRLTNLPAWNTLQHTLSAYEERLKLLNRQNEEINHCLQERSLWTSWASLASIAAFASLSLLVSRTKATLSNNA